MDEFKRKTTLIISIRTFIIFTLFLTVYFTRFVEQHEKLATTFYWVLLISLIINLFFIPLNRLRLNRERLIVQIHLCFDFLLVNFIVFSTGGTGSPFSLLYILIILSASLFMGFHGILIMTGISCAGFILTNLGYLFTFIPTDRLKESARTLILSAEVNLLGYLLVGLLVGFLAERIRSTNILMAQQSVRIQDLEGYNESILASLRSGLLTTDRDLKVVKINRTGLELLGRPSRSLEGAYAAGLFHLTAEETAQLGNSESPHRAIRLEKWLPLAGREPIYLGLSVSPLLQRESIETGFIFSFQDLTEIKQLENSMELQKKMAAIGNLSAAIAHEIRNPLASMMGSIQVLKNQLELTSSQNHLMDIILRESHRLDRTIGNFLQFASTRQFKPRPFDLPALIRETVLLFQNSPEVKPGHQIEMQTAEQQMTYVGDPDKIKQVIWNLCTNAIKAMPTGGRLAIDCGQERGCFRLRFQDDGRGMDETELQHMFEPFHSGFRDGMGLGMAIVYRIVNDHEGRIDVQSQRGAGTCITILLPRQMIHF